jgi:hypothetical protein
VRQALLEAREQQEVLEQQARQDLQVPLVQRVLLETQALKVQPVQPVRQVQLALFQDQQVLQVRPDHKVLELLLRVALPLSLIFLQMTT